MDGDSGPNDAVQYFDTEFDNFASAGYHQEDIDVPYSFSWAENFDHLPNEQRESLESLESQLDIELQIEPQQLHPSGEPWSLLNPSVSAASIERPPMFRSPSTMPDDRNAFMLKDDVGILNTQHRIATSELGHPSIPDAVVSVCRSNDFQKRIKVLGQRMRVLASSKFSALLESTLGGFEDRLSKEEFSAKPKNIKKRKSKVVAGYTPSPKRQDKRPVDGELIYQRCSDACDRCTKAKCKCNDSLGPCLECKGKGLYWCRVDGKFLDLIGVESDDWLSEFWNFNQLEGILPVKDVRCLVVLLSNKAYPEDSRWETVAMGHVVPIDRQEQESGLFAKQMDRFVDKTTISCTFKANKLKFGVKGEKTIFAVALRCAGYLGFLCQLPNAWFHGYGNHRDARLARRILVSLFICALKRLDFLLRHVMNHAERVLMIQPLEGGNGALLSICVVWRVVDHLKTSSWEGIFPSKLASTLTRFSEHVTSRIDILRKLGTACLAAVQKSSTDFVKLAAGVVTDFSVSPFHVKYELATMDIDNPGDHFPPSKDCWQQLPPNRNMVSRTISIGLKESLEVKPKRLFSVFPEKPVVVPSQSDHDWKLIPASMNTNELAASDHTSSAHTSCETKLSPGLQPGHNHAPHPDFKDDEIAVGWTVDNVPYIRCTYFELKRAGTLPNLDASTDTGSSHWSHWSCIQPFFPDTASTTSSGPRPEKLKVHAIADLLEKNSSYSLV
ncbi:hypothetical protein MMC17_002360 [Xylographa soralifera]|nr:hypothetical protein [Xylographa soralifera]